jgi:hypothetical protein
MNRPLVFSVMAAALVMPAAGRATAGADVTRTVYFSAIDAKGAPVTDLTAADLAVKEGGKERAIAGLEAATTPLFVSLLVDDGGSGAFQGPVAQMMERILPHGVFAIRLMNPQPMKLTDFTADRATLQAALGNMGQRGRVQTGGDQIFDAVQEVAHELQQKKAARAAIIVMTVGGETAQSNQAGPALDALKASGASMDVVYLTGIELGQVLGDGPKRSGGTAEQITGGVVPGPLLAKIAENLMHQYMLTYTLPDGVKPNERFALTTSRKGLTLLAPTRIPDK